MTGDGDERTVDLRGYLDAKYTHDLDERVRALEEYVKANPATTPMPASPSRSMPALPQ